MGALQGKGWLSIEYTTKEAFLQRRFGEKPNFLYMWKAHQQVSEEAGTGLGSRVSTFIVIFW
jgi:hypothetical protein